METKKTLNGMRMLFAVLATIFGTVTLLLIFLYKTVIPIILDAEPLTLKADFLISCATWLAEYWRYVGLIILAISAWHLIKLVIAICSKKKPERKREGAIIRNAAAIIVWGVVLIVVIRLKDLANTLTGEGFIFTPENAVAQMQLCNTEIGSLLGTLTWASTGAAVLFSVLIPISRKLMDAGRAETAGEAYARTAAASYAIGANAEYPVRLREMLKNGIIDRKEYKILLEKYRKNYEENRDEMK